MSDLVKAAYDRLLYTISLPERGVRALASVIGGSTSLLTNVLVPEPLQRTTTYAVTVGLLQRYVIEQVAGIQPESPQSEQSTVAENFLMRKLVGNVIEGAGLLSVGYSPLWIFAIVGDTARGGHIYLNRLVNHLRAEGLIDPDFQARSLSDVLFALQKAADDSAFTIDQPPLTRRQLAEQAGLLRQRYADVARHSTALMPRFNRLWNRMEQTAAQEGVRLEQLSGMMALNAADLARVGSGSARAVSRITLDLFEEWVLKSYRQTLDDIAQTGVRPYLRTHYQPFWQQAALHLNPQAASLTEQLLRRKR